MAVDVSPRASRRLHLRLLALLSVLCLTCATSAHGALAAEDHATAGSAARIQDEIERLYHVLLLREGDGGGLRYWTELALAGVPLGAIASAFCQSQEFRAIYGQLGDEEFVSTVYQNAMGRQPDPAGLEHWVSALDGTLTRSSLMLHLVRSGEFSARWRSGLRPGPGPRSGKTLGPATTGRATSPSGHVDRVVYDMYGEPFRDDGMRQDGEVIGAAPWGAHEGLPIGVPRDFAWYFGSRPGLFDGTQGSGRAVTGWGQIFEAEPGTGTYDVRAQVRDHRMYWLLDDGTWERIYPHLDDPEMEGAFWDGWFRQTVAASVRNESRNGGGWSVDLATLASPGSHTWHFWWKGWYPRPVIPANAVGLYTVAEMRLIPDDDPNVDIASARFIGSIAADNYSSSTYMSGGEPIVGVMASRMKYLTSEWQHFSGSSLTEAELRANPPPET